MLTAQCHHIAHIVDRCGLSSLEPYVRVKMVSSPKWLSIRPSADMPTQRYVDGGDAILWWVQRRGWPSS